MWPAAHGVDFPTGIRRFRASLTTDGHLEHWSTTVEREALPDAVAAEPLHVTSARRRRGSACGSTPARSTLRIRSREILASLSSAVVD